MSRTPLDSLPDDPAALKAIIATLEQRSAALVVQNQALEVEKLRLEVELLRLKKWYYGPRADDQKHHGDVAQLLLAFATDLEARPVNPQDLPPPETPAQETEPASVRRVRRGRRDLSEDAAFDHLPLTREEYDLSDDQKPCPCCGEVRQKIGQESSWQVEYVPGRFERIEHVRLKYACRRCEAEAQDPQITVAEKPPQPIDKGLAGPGLLAYVLTSKFADYLPLYRLEAIFQRNGFEIGRATQSVWCGDVADLVKPLIDLCTRRIAGWAMADHLRAELCTDALSMALARRNPGADADAGLVHHSDRGCQYACGAYRQLLAGRGITCSMSPGGRLLRQRGGRELLGHAQTRAGAPAALRDPRPGDGEHLRVDRMLVQSKAAT